MKRNSPNKLSRREYLNSLTVAAGGAGVVSTLAGCSEQASGEEGSSYRSLTQIDGSHSSGEGYSFTVQKMKVPGCGCQAIFNIIVNNNTSSPADSRLHLYFYDKAGVLFNTLSYELGVVSPGQSMVVDKTEYNTTMKKAQTFECTVTGQVVE